MEVVPGRGRVDYRTYPKQFSELPGEIPLILEHFKTPGGTSFSLSRRFQACVSYIVLILNNEPNSFPISFFSIHSAGTLNAIGRCAIIRL